jgi:hypothetical protein
MNHQGKRPDQVKFSEDMVVYGILGMLFVVVVCSVIKLLTNL